MDSQVVNELSAHYRQRTLRFTPKVLTQMGIRRDSVTLVLEEATLSCVPFEFSMDKGSLLTSMSDREIEHFLARKEAPTKLVIARHDHQSKKPEVFHTSCQLKAIVRPNNGSIYCLVQVQFVRLPHEIKEFLVTQFFQADQADSFVANLVDVPFLEQDVHHLFRSHHLVLKKQNAQGERLKILSYSVKEIRLFGEIQGAIPEEGEAVEFLPHQGDLNCLVQGICKKRTPYAELPGFYLLDISHTLTPGAILKLMKLAKVATTPFLAGKP